MCYSLSIKRKVILFFYIFVISITLSYGDDTITQTPGTTSSWLAQGLTTSLMLLGTGMRVLAVPYASSVERQQSCLNLNSIHSDGVMMRLCDSSCTQKCAPQLMLFNRLIDTTPYCTLPVKQTGALSSPHLKDDATNDICRPDMNNRIYLGQKNMTTCLEQNPKAEFLFVESIDFSLFSQKEQNKFPLYNESLPFSGHLTMPPFSLNNFNITRSENAAFFFLLANSNINANFSNAEVTSTTNAALLAMILQAHNTIAFEMDSATIFSGTLVGGIIAYMKPNSYGSIVLKIKKRATIKTKSYRLAGNEITTTGIVANYISPNASYNITMLGNEIFILCEVALSCGGGIGTFHETHSQYNSFFDFKANLVNITASPSVTSISGVVENYYLPITGNLTTKKTSVHIDHLILHGGQYASIIENIPLVHSYTPQKHIIIISNIQANINARQSNAVGIARAHNAQQSPIILLLSGNGTLSEPNHLLFPHGSCSESLIDWSGVSFNTHNVGCANAIFVESITPSGWRTAHHRLAHQVCADHPHACHYVNEVPLALVKRGWSYLIFN